MKVLIAIALFCLAMFPCHAQKAMTFNNVDRYINTAQVIWIVDAVKSVDQGGQIDSGHPYEVKVTQSLKGESPEQIVTVSTVFRGLVPGGRYLFFGFNSSFEGLKETWMDNGIISPVRLPDSFSLAQLEGKSVKQQVVLILSARSTEIDAEIKALADEEKTIESKLESQRQEDKLPGHSSVSTYAPLP